MDSVGPGQDSMVGLCEHNGLGSLRERKKGVGVGVVENFLTS